MATTKTSYASMFQKFFGFITPILVTAFGLLLNNSVNKTQAELSKMKTDLEQRIAPVREMKPYMEMLSDTSVTKNILGAYSIYMLKKDDSRIAAQMIAAVQKEHLVDILRTLGKDDDGVQQVLDELGNNNYDLTPMEYASFDQKFRDSLKLTPMQRYALEVKGSIERNNLREADFEGSSELTRESDLSNAESNIIISKNADGWIYLGEGNSLIVDMPKGEVLKERIYKLNSATNLRADYPNKENQYRLARKLKVVSKGSEIKIETINNDKSHYWAKVKLILKIETLADNLFSSNKEVRTTAAQDIVAHAKDNPAMLRALIESVVNCLNDDGSNDDCTNGIYNAGVVLNNLDPNLIKSKASEIEEILENIPDASPKSRAFFKKLLD